MSTPHTPELEELLPAYALGALDGEDLERLRAHLDAGCPECEREIEAWRRDLGQLALEVEPVAPPPAARGRLLAAAVPAASPVAAFPGDRAPSAPRARRSLRWLPLAAALLLLLGGAAAHVRLRAELARVRSERDAAVRRAGRQEAELAAVQAHAARLAATLSRLASPGTRIVSLAGLAEAPGASGRAFVDPEAGRALFYAHDLPPLPADKTYQLWFIESGRPVSAGIFAVDRTGGASLEVERVAPAERIDAWAVTVEPRGGLPQPSGPMVLKG